MMFGVDMAGLRVPAALGQTDASADMLSHRVEVARHIHSVVRHRGLSPVDQLNALLCVAAGIVARVPPDQDAQAARLAHALLDLNIVVAAQTQAGCEA